MDAGVDDKPGYFLHGLNKVFILLLLLSSVS